MAGRTIGTSMVENLGSEIGICDSQNENKRLKSSAGEEEEEDRFSALPESLIHRILSLLPATDLVKTLVLSKWWKYQWINVPVLKFVPIDGMSPNKFYNFIDKTLILHDCSNIEKFVLKLNCFHVDEQVPELNSWITFALGRNVKELIVNFNENYDIEHCLLPQFLFNNNSSLIKLKVCTCSFTPVGDVNWGSLKSLRLRSCVMQDKKFENVISGCPLLEYLELCGCDVFSVLVITSESLRTLILDEVNSACIAVEISCPYLERLKISGLAWFTSLKLWNLPSSVYATLDFYFDQMIFDMEDDISHDDIVNVVEQTLSQVEHVEKVEIGRWLLEILSPPKWDRDCTRGLTDSVIRRIISSFPSIKDAFETDLYESWQLKWTDAPIFNFVSNEKFVIDSKDVPLMYLDPRLTLWIRIATRKDVKELILDCDAIDVELGIEYILPQFIFDNSSLVKIKICACDFMPLGKVNWESLKSLELEYSEVGSQAIEHVLSGSPLLECLGLHRCGFQGELVIASEHLKTFLLDDTDQDVHRLEISCPNLERLIMRGNLGSIRLKLTNLPSSLHANFDMYVWESDDISPDACINLIEEITKQIRHVEVLEIELSREPLY